MQQLMTFITFSGQNKSHCDNVRLKNNDEENVLK